MIERILGLILMATLLAGCGQPLRFDTPAAAARPSQRPLQSATGVSGTPFGQGSPARATPQASPLPTVAATPTLPPTAAATADVPTAVAPPQRPSVVVVPQQPMLTNEERWRAQQQGRDVFPELRVYVARRPAQLLWYDPITGQSLPVGTLLGPFTAQAAFTLRSADAPALEVPYKINGSFGLTAIAPSVLERMARAGFTEYVETYVIMSDDVVLKE